MKLIYNIYSKYILLALLVALAGCSSAKLDTGQVDYRPFVTEDGKDAKSVDFRYYLESSKTTLEETNRIIRTGDSVGIKILQGFICDFTELSIFKIRAQEEWIELLKNYFKIAKNRRCNYAKNGRTVSRTRGEIAVLASAFELGKGKKIEFYKSVAGNEAARVVYFDADVRQTGQFLNMSNLPLYGPITYNGGPLFFRIFVLEIDADENDVSSSLLSELARLGRVAYPPASPVLSVLQSMGQVFSDRSSDDLEFKYDMSFDGEDALTTSNAHLLHGNYVFIRNDDRFGEIPWYEFTLNHRTGRLEYTCDVWLLAEFITYGEKVTNCEDDTYTNINRKKYAKFKNSTCSDCLQIGKPGQEYKQFTYFTIKITKNERALEQDVGQTLSDFRSQPVTDKYDFSSLTQTFVKFGKDVELNALFDTIRADLHKLSIWPPVNAVGSLTGEAIAKHICEKTLTDDQKSYILQRLSSTMKHKESMLLDPKKLTLKGLKDACIYAQDEKSKVAEAKPGGAKPGDPKPVFDAMKLFYSLAEENLKVMPNVAS